MTVRTGVMLFLLSVLLTPTVLSRPVGAACVVDAKATIPLDVSGGAITVPVEVNGIIARFILDTGALRSVVTQATVQRLGLARDQWAGTAMSGIGGGIGQRPNAKPRSLSLGGVPLVRRTVTRDMSLTVSVLPGAPNRDAIIDGLLGRDFLSLFDLDLDMPGRRLTLYQVKDCAGRFLPWPDHYASIPVSITGITAEAIIVPVIIDGTPLRAMLDTGAGANLIAAPGMYRLGLDPASLAGDPSDQIHGLGPGVLTAHRHQFRSLRVGNQIIGLPVLWAEPVRLMPFVDMLLGADWLAGRRVWISFTTKQLFVAIP